MKKVPMPCMKCHKVTKVPENSLYCADCSGYSEILKNKRKYEAEKQSQKEE